MCKIFGFWGFKKESLLELLILILCCISLNKIDFTKHTVTTGFTIIFCVLAFFSLSKIHSLLNGFAYICSSDRFTVYPATWVISTYCFTFSSSFPMAQDVMVIIVAIRWVMFWWWANLFNQYICQSVCMQQ